MIEGMRKVVIALGLILLVRGRVGAQELATMPAMRGPGSIAEMQAYTFDVKADGTASVWMRADSVAIPMAGGEYTLTLPEGSGQGVSAYYRESGCTQYRGDICISYAGNNWQEAEVRREGDKVTVVIPKRKVDVRDEGMGVAIGLLYKMERDVTNKRWWGREVVLETAKSDQLVASLSIGVYLPEGVYARDKQEGPQGWAAALSEVNTRGAGAPMLDAKMGAGSLLEQAGSGEIYRYRQNLVPGESYTMRIMSSTSRWRLFGREIGTMLIFVILIATVLSLLMYLVVGRRPWWWYVVVTLLLVALFVLVAGLWISLRFGVGASGGGSYPVMMRESVAL